MPTTYKDKISSELNSIPEDMLPKFYKIFHTLIHEMLPHKKEMTTVIAEPKSLYGIWSNCEIEDSLIRDARASLFSYEKKGQDNCPDNCSCRTYDEPKDGVKNWFRNRSTLGICGVMGKNK
jgi:hypothetical protein